MSTLLWVATLSSSGALIYVSIKLIQTQRERNQLQRDLRRYESLTSREETEKQLDSNIQLKQSEQEKLKIKIKKSEFYLRELQAKEYLIKIDEYEPKYDFVTSQDYRQRWQKVKSEQKKMRNNKQAFICDTSWKKGEGKQGEKEGKKMINELLKMIEYAFEKQCKYNIKEVKYNNVKDLKKEIENTFDKINGYFKTIDCRISVEYLQLKLTELDIKYEFEEKLQEEKERERASQEQMKKEEKDRRAIEKAEQEAEEAEQRERQYQEDLERVHLEKEKAVGLAREEYERQIKDLEQQLSQANIDKEKAISRSKRIKSGHIYVISNIGSIGRGVYRIFMTRNSSPDAYIRSMNPSVPFPFDIHYKIFSEDALETVQYLHQHFNDRRVNIVNERRDFFKLELSEIEQVLLEIERETGALTFLLSEKAPQAYEYRKTQAAERKKSNDTTINEIA